jgi:hypothetical protein
VARAYGCAKPTEDLLDGQDPTLDVAGSIPVSRSSFHHLDIIPFLAGQETTQF